MRTSLIMIQLRYLPEYVGISMFILVLPKKMLRESKDYISKFGFVIS